MPCTVARYKRANCLSLESSVKPWMTPFAFGSAIGDLGHHIYIYKPIIQEPLLNITEEICWSPNTCSHGSREKRVNLQSGQLQRIGSVQSSLFPRAYSEAQRLKSLKY